MLKRITTLGSNPTLQPSTSYSTHLQANKSTNLLQFALPDKMATGITVTNKSTTDIFVSVTYDGTDFQKGGSEQWFTLKANGGSDTWNYRAGNQIARVARSQTSGTPVESYLAVPGQTINIY
ncbi:ekdA [Botrytis cinerea T4]|uniref:EkdA n=2 Tax=Botryotinia fuckeliana TaxID=40559 RepID=G2YFU1_BOTF4|nr:ekdA [Botrytis cinerea T4]